MIALFGFQSIGPLGIFFIVSIPGYVHSHLNMVVTSESGQSSRTRIMVALDVSSDGLNTGYNAQTNPYKVKTNFLADVTGTVNDAEWRNNFKYRLFDDTYDQFGLTYCHSDSGLSYFTKNEDKLEARQKLPPPANNRGAYNYPDWEIVVARVGSDAQPYKDTVPGLGTTNNQYQSSDIHLDAIVGRQSDSGRQEKFTYLLNILRPYKWLMVDDQKVLQYSQRDRFDRDFFLVKNPQPSAPISNSPPQPKSSDFGNGDKDGNDAGPKDWVIEVEFAAGGDNGFLIGKSIYRPRGGIPVYHVLLPEERNLLAVGNRFYLKPKKSLARGSEVFYLEKSAETVAFSTQKPTK